jgi:hypothetical protein
MKAIPGPSSGGESVSGCAFEAAGKKAVNVAYFSLSKHLRVCGLTDKVCRRSSAMLLKEVLVRLLQEKEHDLCGISIPKAAAAGPRP